MSKARFVRLVKRLADIVFSFVSLLILSPLLLITGLCVRICSSGPIIYKAKRVGMNGKPFIMLKFRTMYVNTADSPIITLRSDSRIFPFGRFLRKTKIDELPQLWNVLIGQMSIVGPRPEDVDIARALYVGKYKHIMDVRPGLTSPGSLYDYTVGETYEDEEEYRKNVLNNKLNLELYYVKNIRLWYDCKLIIQTMAIILGILIGKTKFKPPKELNEIIANE